MLDYARVEIPSDHICDVLGLKVRSYHAELNARVRKLRVGSNYLAATEADRSGAAWFYPAVSRLRRDQAPPEIVLQQRSAKA